MRLLPFIFFIISINVAAQKIDLKKYRWKNRIVLVENYSKEAYQKQQQLLTTCSKEMEERKVIVVYRKSQSNTFKLVGLDGGVKRTAKAPFTCEILTEAIDAMPMRRAEMKKSSTSGQ